MPWDATGTRIGSGPPVDTGMPHARRWTWRLGFGLAILFVWFWIGLYFMLLAIGSMGDCFGAQPCADLQQQGLADGAFWGKVFAASALVATILGIATAEGRRWAAPALVIFSVAVTLLTCFQPDSDTGMRATGVMGIGLAPFAALAAWRWWSSQQQL